MMEANLDPNMPAVSAEMKKGELANTSLENHKVNVIVLQ